jgi:hypothetical protein
VRSFLVLREQRPAMRIPGRSIFWRNLRRRVATAAALLAYLAGAFGLPLPAAAPVKPKFGMAHRS